MNGKGLVHSAGRGTGSIPTEPEAFTQPHWSDERVQRVARAVWDDTTKHTALPFSREDAVRFWPGLEARRFLTMVDALANPGTAP